MSNLSTNMSTVGAYSNSFFGLGRNRPFPSSYAENKTAVTVDVLEAGWIAAFITLYFCFLLILPAKNGTEKIYYFIRITLSLFIGLTIMMVNFGQEWEVGEIHSHTAYKAGTGTEIIADIGLKLGLRSVNITLKATEQPTMDLSHEKIDYNERYYFIGEQGRFGFGQFAGRIQREFRASQFRGVPYPILWIAEFFIFDGEGLRFGRNYRLAGLYCRMCIWTAFPVWILTIVMFKLVISYGALMLMFLGLLMTLTSLIWAFRRNFLELSIIFADGVLRTHFGFHWYLCLVVGLACVLAGASIYFLNKKYHTFFCKFMNIDPFNIYDQEIHNDIIDDIVQSNDIEMKDFNYDAPKKIKRTVTIRAKGAKDTSKNFTTTHTIEKLPEDFNQMEEIYSADYSVGYGGTSELHGRNLHYPIEAQHNQEMMAENRDIAFYPTNQQHFENSMEMSENLGYHDQNITEFDQAYGTEMNEYIVDEYGQPQYQYPVDENRILLQNYDNLSHQPWNENRSAPDLPPRKH